MKKILIAIIILYNNSLFCQSIEAKKIKGFFVMELRVAETHSPIEYYFCCGQYFISKQNIRDTILITNKNEYAFQVKDFLIRKGDSTALKIKIESNYIPINDSNYFHYVWTERDNPAYPYQKNQKIASFQLQSNEIYIKGKDTKTYWIVFAIKGKIWDCKEITILEEDKLEDEAFRHYQSNYLLCNCSRYVPHNHIYCPKSKMKLSSLSKTQRTRLQLVKSNLKGIEILSEL